MIPSRRSIDRRSSKRRNRNNESQESIDYSLSSSDDENPKPKPGQSLLDMSKAIDQETDVTKSQVNEPAGIYHEQVCKSDRHDQMPSEPVNTKP